MNHRQSLEQTRQKSIEVWAQAQKQALHEAVRNTPVAPATAAGLGTGSGGALDEDNTVNNYVVNDYVENYFE
jgi:hypothetical protein